MPASTDSILNSIKGRIWLAVSALAVLDCFCGLGAYLAVSFFVTDTFITIFVTFFVLAFVTMVFGWWLSNDVIRPLDSVTLLAKALERSPNTTLPRTTGSTETDELLRTLHRNSQQLQNLISMMDDVAAGRTDAVSMPLENSDKLSASFQKLVSRVTDSISAKRELDSLEGAIAAINTDISGIRSGKLELQVRAEHPHTKEIADTFRYLANRLDQLARGVQVSSVGANSAAAEAKRSLRTFIDSRDESSIRLERGLSAMSELPIKAESVVRDADSAIAAFESAVSVIDPTNALAGLSKAGEMAMRIAETARKFQKLRSRVSELPQIGRTANEIARRSHLIALNTAIQSEGDNAASFDLLVNEVNSLSSRAETLNKDIRTFADSLTSEIGDLSTAFTDISAGSGETARGYERVAQILVDYRSRFAELAAVRAKLAEFSKDQSAESEKIREVVNAVSNDRSEETMIRDAELQVQKLITLVENLHDSVSDLRGSGVKPFAAQHSGQSAPGLPFERTSPEPSELIGENQ